MRLNEGGQVNVGEPGTEQHTQRERLLRTAIDLRSRITEAQDRYNAVIAMLPAAAGASTAAAAVQGCASISEKVHHALYVSSKKEIPIK